MANFEVTTLLALRDQATAPLQRFIALLKDAQLQLERTMGAVKLLQDAQGPSSAVLAMQRESLGLTQREATLRADIAANAVRQSEATVAASRESLVLAKQQLDVQRAIRVSGAPGFITSARKAGSNLMWGGVGIVGGLAYATQKAIDFNQTTLQTDTALGGFQRSVGQRAQDMAALQKAAFAGSSATGFFTAQDIMSGLQKAASSGMRPLVDKMGMGVFTQIVPTLAQYMDVLGRLKGESADTAALEAMQLVHMFGSYTPAAINKTLNGVAMLSLLMPDTMGKAISALSYVAPTGVQLAGMDVSDIAAFVATADQSGLGRGRSGARLKDYIESIAVVQSKARERAKTALGIRGAIGSHGELDLAKSFDILIGDKQRMTPQAFRDAVRVAFGAQGDVVAAMFGDKSKTGMFQANRAAIQGSMDRGDLTTVQNILKGGAAGREAAAWATLQNDIVKFGQYGVPIALKFFDTINPKLKQFADWADSHPQDVKRMFDDMLKVGEGMLIVGGAFKVIAGMANAVTVIRGIASGFSVLYPVASKLPGPLATVAAVLGTIYDDVKEFDKFKAQGFRLSPWDVFRESLGPLGALLPRNLPGGGGGHVTQHVTVNMTLPKDSDAGTARRILQHVTRLAGGAFPASMNGYVVPGSYNSVPSHP